MAQKNEGCVLLVDDEEAIRDSIGELLDACGFKVLLADCFKNAVKTLDSGEEIEVVLCDLKMPDESGLEVLKYLNKINKNIPFIILTGYATIESCQDAVKEGAFDYILKTVIENKDKVINPLKHAVEKYRLQKENKEMRADIIRIAEEHQNIMEKLISDSQLKNDIQEKITKILDKWG